MGECFLYGQGGGSSESFDVVKVTLKAAYCRGITATILNTHSTLSVGAAATFSDFYILKGSILDFGAYNDRENIIIDHSGESGIDFIKISDDPIQYQVLTSNCSFYQASCP